MSAARLTTPRWDLEHLQAHLQGVVELELWTVPYYLSAMYSVKDPSCEVYQLIQDVVHEEMLHIQFACNIANAFACVPRFPVPAYGEQVPHIDFALDDPNPADEYKPYSAHIGALDTERVNTMCLIEYPAWSTERQPDLHQDREQYGSIAEFYEAVRAGMYELRTELRGGVNQIDEFRPFYNDLNCQTIDFDGDRGYVQALALIDVITDQGEGQSVGDTAVAPAHQNTADGFNESWSHFRKFSAIRELGALPAVYEGAVDPPPGTPARRAQETLVADFDAFLKTLEAGSSGAHPEGFGGTDAGGFGAQMAKLGGDVLTCWQLGAVPRFSLLAPEDNGG